MAETAKDLRASRPAHPARSPLSGGSSRGRAALPAVSAVFWNEIRQVTSGIRFRVSAFLLMAVMALAAVTAGARYRDDVLAQTFVTERHTRETAGLSIDLLAEERHPALKPPWRLSLVVDGGQTETPDLYGQALSALVTPEVRRIRGGNGRLPSREPLDWMFVIRILLPLAAFLLSYDAVCGERRVGTLKLLLSYPVPRWKVLAGKLLALWSCLAAPLLSGGILSLLLARMGGIPLTAGDLARAGMVLLLGLWAAFFFVLAALMVSALSRDPSASLSMLAWLWVTGVIVVPAVSGLLAHRLRPVPTAGETALRIKAIARQHAAGEARWRQPEWAAADGFAWERRSAAEENRRFELPGGNPAWCLPEQGRTGPAGEEPLFPLSHVAHPGPGGAPHRLGTGTGRELPRAGPKLPDPPRGADQEARCARSGEPSHPLFQRLSVEASCQDRRSATFHFS